MERETKWEREYSWGRGAWTFGLIAFVAGACLGSVPSLAAAQTIIVNTLTDKADPPFNTDSSCSVGTIADLPATRSLREAIIAANNTPGSQTITFAPGLSGGTINVNFDNLDADPAPNPLPGICDSDTTINGDLNSDGVPDITLNGAALSIGANGLFIFASRDIVQGLWFKDFPNTGIGIFHAVGITSLEPEISDNVIRNNYVQGGIVSILLQSGSTPGFPGSVKNTLISGNAVSSAAFQGIQVSTGDASGSSIDSTTITGNSSSLSGIGIHLFTNLSAIGSNTSLTNVKVTDNLVSGNGMRGIFIHPFAGDNNTITGVVIARNTVSDDNVGIIVRTGDSGSNGNLLKATVKNNLVSDNSFSGGTAGIFVDGGSLSSSNNHLQVHIIQNTVTDNAGSGMSVLAGQDDSSNNSVIAKIRKNTLERNGGDGIAISGGIGASFLPIASSNNNTLDVAITGNTIRDHTLSGIVMTGGVGNSDGRLGVSANGNQVTAKVNNNTVEGSDLFGIKIVGGSSGLASVNLVSAKVMKNRVCDSGMTDIQVYGGFPGDASTPPVSGVINIAQVKATKNTATTIAATNGVAGNFAFLTQSENVPCP